TGEVFVEAGQPLPAGWLLVLPLPRVVVLEEVRDPLILDSLEEGEARTHEAALLALFRALRPGSPPQLDRARALARERFADPARHSRGAGGRLRVNRRLSGLPGLTPGSGVGGPTGAALPRPADGGSSTALLPEDLVGAIRGLLALRAGRQQPDDLDHL